MCAHDGKAGLEASSGISSRLLWKTAMAVSVFALGIAWGVPRASAQAQVTSERIAHADTEPQNWLTFFGNYKAWSYSSLDQITRANVKELAPAWAFSTGGRGGLEAAPIVADGKMYLVNQENDVFALDAGTGRPLWKYAYKAAKDARAANGKARGVAIGYGMIFMATRDNHLVALDANTGKEAWNIEIENSAKCGCGISSAPLLVKNKVITGVTGGESAHRGYISAFEAKTGKLAWRFYTIPEPGQPGSETWTGDSWRLGGGSSWFTGSYDPELNLIYWGVGNPSSDLYGGDRMGANLYTDSLVALDADTGKLKWYFQETPHDVYDYDSDPEPVLIDVQENGQTRKLVIHSSKNGFAYVLDRETGKFIRGFPYVDTVTWTKGLDKDGKPVDPVMPELGKVAKDYVFCPGTQGGRNRNHSAYSPVTGWWYTSALEVCSHITPQRQEAKEGESFWGGLREEMLNPNAAPHIAAFDPLTGKKEWSFPTKFFNVSSLLTTAGNLVFGGDLEGNAFALDAQTGQKLWSFNTGSRIASAPVSYSIGGRQYIAIASGGGSLLEARADRYWPEAKTEVGQEASTLFVFALPGQEPVSTSEAH
jgi:alcohol dehydrogenase (cytochrome c)